MLPFLSSVLVAACLVVAVAEEGVALLGPQALQEAL